MDLFEVNVYLNVILTRLENTHSIVNSRLEVTLEKASSIVRVIVRYGKLIYDRLETPLTRFESTDLTALNRQLSHLRFVVPVL